MTKGIDKYSIDSTDYTVGQDNVQKWGFDVHNPVFGISAGLIALFLASWFERMISHTGTETRPRLLREAAVGNIAQWAQA